MHNQPEDQQEAAEHAAKLSSIGYTIAKMRDEAVNARKASGFEIQWREDEEYYNGVDDHNRASEQYLKSRSTSGGLVTKNDKNETRCTAFFNLTRQFVDSASARACDILLPANEWNFNLKPTPVPEFEEHEDDDTPMILGADGEPQVSVGQAIKERNDKANKQVRKAKRRIQDWMVECNYKSESRKVIDGAAMVGVGILKGPFPTSKTTKEFTDNTLVLKKTVVPASKRVDHWDFFPDMNCGENIQDGDYVFERDHMTARQLRALKGSGLGYLDSAIDQVINEGPNKINLGTEKSTQDDERFEVWYYYGTISKKKLSMLDNDCVCEDDDDDELSAVVVLVNDTVIKGYINPLENEEYPFDVFVWQRMAGQPFGVGVARQARTAQKQINAAARALMDNMAISAIPMLGLLRGAVTPADGDWTIRGGKAWYIKESSGVTDLAKAIQTMEMPTRQQELTAIIELGAKMMEDATGVSTLLQGDQGDSTKTVGGMSMLHENASSLLRRYTRAYDDGITVPHIKRWHDYLLMDPDIPDDEKGDLDIEAIGSTHLVERHIQTMQLPMILQLAQNPVFEKSPKKTFDEVLRAYRFDPAKFDMDDEEKEALENQQQPPAPQVQAAQIRAETDMQKEQMKQQTDMQKVQMQQQMDAQKTQADIERETAQLQSQRMEQQQQQEYLLQKLAMERELAMLKYANERDISLSKVKSELSQTAMRLNLQKELAADNKKAQQVATPAAEPVGRARDGRAFQE